MEKCTLDIQREIYKGEQKNILETLGLNHTEKSSRFWNTGHEINNSADLLKSVNRKNELIIWGKKYLSLHVHITL